MEPTLQHPQTCEFRTSVMWFRRDLRVDDNPALVAALTASATVIPVFIWAPEEEGQFQQGRCSRWWTKHSLVDLQQALAALGSRLIIRRSTDSTAALLEIVAEVGAEAVFFNHLYDPISLMRDHDCKRGLTAAGVAHRTFNGDMLYEPWDVLDGNKQPYSTFDDFWNSVRNMPVPPPFPMPAPEAMPPVPASVSSLTVTQVDWFFTAEQEASSDQLKFKWQPGVGGAIAELERFVGQRLHIFEHDRAKVDRDSTSRLSPWIHIGSISVRYIFYRVKQCQAEWLVAGVDRTRSCDDFLQQVGYREYSRYLSFHFPFIHERSLLRHLRACPWRIDQNAFKAWRQGQTGYPIIDAAMRQLWSSGWCHNRARVVAASFLVKDLLLPWQWGLKHYWDAQIDADLECDALGWQYVSGGMSDAHPFSYMMDLEKEALRFDPDGEYVRRWLPVLSRLPTEYIHAPWKAPPQVLAAADVELGCNYPAPIISRQDAKANVDYACSVLDKCAMAQSSESSGRYPYRAPTYPAAFGAAGASSGANPTGAAGGVSGNAAAGPSAGTGAGTATGQTATNRHNMLSPPPSQLQPGGQTCGGGASAGDGATGRVSGQQPGSRSVSAAHGGVSSNGEAAAAAAACTGSGPHRVTAGGTGIMAPPPPHHSPGPKRVSGPGGDGSAAGGSSGAGNRGPAAPAAALGSGGVAGGSGMVYYHPGDSAGQEMLERILQQQRRTRGAARQPDGSGTNHPPGQQHQSPQQQQQQVPPLPFVGLGFDGGATAAAAAAAAAAAWAQRVQACEEDEEAVALWQQQQMLQGGTAAFAFEQAMQMLLARRRMGDGVSNFVGGDAKGGPGGVGGDNEPDGLMLDDADSEEVVSNTVNLNVTAFTGASCHRYQAGTARGARRRGRAEAEAAAQDSRGEDEDERDCESPGGSSPPKSAGDEADPEADGEPGRRGAAASRKRADFEADEADEEGEEEEEEEEAMDCEGDADGDGTEDGSPVHRSLQQRCRGRGSDAEGQLGYGREEDKGEDRMVDCDEEGDGDQEERVRSRARQLGGGGRGGGQPAAEDTCGADIGRGEEDAEMVISPRSAAVQAITDPREMAGLLGQEQQWRDAPAGALAAAVEAEAQGGHALHGLHKRRRSGSLDWE